MSPWKFLLSGRPPLKLAPRPGWPRSPELGSDGPCLILLWHLAGKGWPWDHGESGQTQCRLLRDNARPALAAAPASPGPAFLRVCSGSEFFLQARLLPVSAWAAISSTLPLARDTVTLKSVNKGLGNAGHSHWGAASLARRSLSTPHATPQLMSSEFSCPVAPCRGALSSRAAQAAGCRPRGADRSPPLARAS